MINSKSILITLFLMTQIYNIFYFNYFNIQIIFQFLQNNILFQNKIY